jgi:hypothetical protein
MSAVIKGRTINATFSYDRVTLDIDPADCNKVFFSADYLLIPDDGSYVVSKACRGAAALLTAQPEDVGEHRATIARVLLEQDCFGTFYGHEFVHAEDRKVAERVAEIVVAALSAPPTRHPTKEDPSDE